MLTLAVTSIPKVARVPNRAVLSVVGSQAIPFLNGLLGSSVGERPFYSTFLHPQGKVLYDVFLYTHTDASGKPGFLIEHDSRPSEASPLLQVIKRYVLRAKVKIRDVSDEYDTWAAWGSERERAWETEREWNWAQSAAVEPNWKDTSGWPWGNTPGSLRDRRAVGMGERMLVRKGDLPNQAATHERGDDVAYTLHRILHGVPEGIDDMIPLTSFPMESNLDVMGGLDFRKGCYVGQELTVRTYHTGAIRKRIFPVVIHKPELVPTQVAPTTDVPSLPLHLDVTPTIHRDPGEERRVPRLRGTGRLLTNIHGVGLALLRTEQVSGADLGMVKFEAQDGKRTWGLSHWVPSWFPERTVAKGDL